MHSTIRSSLIAAFILLVEYCSAGELKSLLGDNDIRYHFQSHRDYTTLSLAEPLVRPDRRGPVCNTQNTSINVTSNASQSVPKNRAPKQHKKVTPAKSKKRTLGLIKSWEQNIQLLFFLFQLCIHSLCDRDPVMFCLLTAILSKLYNNNVY